MRTFALSSLSFALTILVLGNAFFQKKQFYPSIVYLTKSNSSTAVLYLQGIVLIYLLGKALARIFFGQLRPTEVEHLIERGWYAITETCLAFAAFRDDLSFRFFTMFTLLLFIKCFHWLAEDRVDFMERSPVITRVFHLRAIGVLTCLCLLDSAFIRYAYRTTLARGASVQLVFGFEYAILFVFALGVWQKYILHAIDSRSDEPWDRKAILMLWGELVLSAASLLLYAMFIFIMLRVHAFPLFAIRPAYTAFRSFKLALSDMVLSRRAIRIMQQRYPDATAEDLSSSDNVCIICREEMLPDTGCKKLPCGHMFHSNCLRSWFQRQQTCPTCRMDVLRDNQQQQQQQQQQQPPAAAAAAAAAPSAPSSASADSQAAAAAASGSAAASSSPPAAFFLPSADFSASIPAAPAPLLPDDLKQLSEAELRRMEAWNREALERRVEHLQRISALLDAAVLQMGQYTQLMARIGPPPPLAEDSQAGACAAAASAPAAGSAAEATANSTSSSTKPAVKSENWSPEPAASQPASTVKPESPSVVDEKPDLTGSGSASSATAPDQSEIRRRRLLHLSSRDGLKAEDEDSLD
ncbi:hypothetical protein BOX15_Mlig032555g1 [Macrostomum lignano]|uniref:RING-type E3 ubiquitin transferase n=1 Tax=Macrostomum lignano TaxID=282301 RepID=A0A267G995_9PLAT|nr:hypothetical protein BOX15_Mlig032555g1 [Macrostomum lignano]